MLNLTWNVDRFNVVTDRELDTEKLYWNSINNDKNKLKIIKFLRNCDFNIRNYMINKDNEIKINKYPIGTIPIADEGTGFNIIFQLLGYILIGEDIEIVESSIKYNIHPILWDAVRSKLTENDCIWLSPVDVRKYLKCAVNPMGACGNCEHFESSREQVIRFV